MSMKVAVQLRHSVIGIPQLFYLCVPIIRILQGIQVPKAVQSEAFSFERQARAEDRYGVSTSIWPVRIEHPEATRTAVRPTHSTL